MVLIQYFRMFGKRFYNAESGSSEFFEHLICLHRGFNDLREHLDALRFHDFLLET